MKKIYASLLGMLLISFSYAQLNLQWVKNISGIDDERPYRIVTDASENIYTAGYYFGPSDFDPGSAIIIDTAIGFTDAFISKMDATGNYVWHKTIGGGSIDNCFGLSIDPFGGVYIAGYFHDTINISIGSNPLQLISNGVEDIFVCKLDANNGNFIWAKSLGGSNADIARNITADGHGNVFITGFFMDTVDFDPGANTTTLISGGNTDVFVLKLDTNGNYVNAFQIGGSGHSEAYHIKNDISGNIFITGYFRDTVDFDPSVNFMNITSVAGNDIFVAKYDATGNYVWAKQMGGTGYERGTRLALDNSGNIVVTGNFDGPVDFNPGPAAFNLASYGNDDCFIAKLNATGNLLWAKRIGGSDFEEPNDMILDNQDNILITGYYNNTVDFDPGAATQNLVSTGTYSDLFIAKYDSSGNYLWAKSIGGNGYESANALVLNGNNLYVTGFYQYTVDFDPETAVYNQISVGGEDAFTAKFTITPSGVFETNSIFNFEIYPNPSNGIFYINCEEPIDVVEIRNITGQLVGEFRSNKIELMNQAAGMYYISIITKKGVSAKKIVVY